jgi:hypothetical protein
MIDFTAFSHGQVLSKLWLCRTIEPILQPQSRVAILGSWYNVLAFMMLTRNSSLYQFILGVDQNYQATEVSERICDAWRFGYDKKISNVTQDAGKFNIDEFNVVINCSVEHMPNDWYDRVPTGALVCIQSSDVTDMTYPWLVTNPNPDQETLVNKYPLNQTLFLGEKEFDYGSWGYKRFMIIGRK